MSIVFYKDDRNIMRLRISLNNRLIAGSDSHKIFDYFTRLWSIEYDMRWAIQREKHR